MEQAKALILRTPLALRAGACLVIIGFIAIAAFAVASAVRLGNWVDAPFAENWSGWALLSIPFFLGPAFLLWRTTVVPYLELLDEALVVRNPFRSVAIPWADIRQCAPGYWGLEIELASGSRIVAVAVQKSNFASWFHRSTRADETCAQIMKMHAAARDVPR